MPKTLVRRYWLSFKTHIYALLEISGCADLKGPRLTQRQRKQNLSLGTEGKIERMSSR